MRFGVDVGSVRVGLAASDPAGVLATPVDVLRRDQQADRDLTEIAAAVRDRDAIEVVVGLPLPLRGGDNPASQKARAYARRLARLVAPVGVRLVDERFSTTQATRSLRLSGKRGRAARNVVDAAAAVILLQAALDTERVTGQPPGELVQP